MRAKALTLIIATILALVGAEFTIRAIAPQDFSGAWRVWSPCGNYFLNKDHGSAHHVLGSKAVRYRFAPAHLRTGGAPETAEHQVLVLGDSFAFGWLLSDADHFVARLQLAVDRNRGPGAVRFLNAATAGWGTAHYTAYYEDFGAMPGVGTVLVFLNIQDVGRSARAPLYRLTDDGTDVQRLPARASNWLKTLVALLPGAQYLAEHSHALRLVRNGLKEIRRRRGNRAQLIPPAQAAPLGAAAADRLPKALFRHLKRLAQSRNQRLIVLTTGWHRFPDAGGDAPTAAFMTGAADFFRQEDIMFHDISDAVFAAADGNVANVTFADDAHPNARGARAIADAAWQVLEPLIGE